MANKFTIVLIAGAFLSGCRCDFIVFDAQTKREMFRSCGESGGWEWPFQVCGSNEFVLTVQYREKGRSTVRQYDVAGEVRRSWDVPFDFTPYEENPVVVGGKMLVVKDEDERWGNRPFLWQTDLDTLKFSVVSLGDLADDGMKLVDAWPVKDHNVVLYRKQIFRKDRGRYEDQCGAKLVLIDPNKKKVLSQVALPSVNPVSREFRLSPAHDMLCVKSEEVVMFFAADLSKIDQLQVGEFPCVMSEITLRMEWTGSVEVTFVDICNGNWFAYNVLTKKVVRQGKISLEKAAGNVGEEHIHGILSRDLFFTSRDDKWCNIVETKVVQVNSDGSETAIGKGGLLRSWHEPKLLTPEIFFDLE